MQPAAVIDDQPRTDAAKGARSAVALLLSINLFNYVDRYVLAAVEPDIAKSFFPNEPDSAATLAKMGSLATAFLVSYMITAPIFGWLADRISRWLLVGVGVIVWSLASGGSGLANTFGILMVTRMFVGIGEAAYGPAAPTIIADLYPVNRRGSVLAWFYMAIPVGSAIGFGLGAAIGSWLGWRWAFYAVVPPGIVLGILCLMRRDPRRHTNVNSDAPKTKVTFKDYVALFRIRSFLLNTAAMTAMTFAIGGISFWMPRYLTEVRGLPASSKIWFGAITAVAGLFATLLGGIAGDRLRNRGIGGAYFIVSAIGILIAAPCVILMLYLPFPFAWIAAFAAVFWLFFNTGPSNTAIANVTHPSMRATAFALNILVIHTLGDAISPSLLGATAGTFSWNVAFFVVAAVMALAGALWLWGARYLQADTLAAEADPATTERRIDDTSTRA
ncbi:MAG: MFS transporter [Anaerolineae bacterium]|nr:MFS transporter [Phycisphaerae bacterium]